MDLDEFLRHLYFGDHCFYPPYMPATGIDLKASTIDWADEANLLQCFGGTPCTTVYIEELLTLAHYLQCTQMMRHCEEVFLSKLAWLTVNADDGIGRNEDLINLLVSAGRC